MLGMLLISASLTPTLVIGGSDMFGLAYQSSIGKSSVITEFGLFVINVDNWVVDC